MLNTRNLHSFGTNRIQRKAAPPRALANYLKASEGSQTEVKDEVQLSQAARSSQTGSGGLGKTATLVALGVTVMGLFGGGTAVAAESAAPVQTEKVSEFEQAGKDLREFGLEAGRQGREFGKEAAEVGKQIGNEAAKVGKEIGQKGKEFGQDVGNAAKQFWKGLTGK